jgi:hypothetical protein
MKSQIREKDEKRSSQRHDTSDYRARSFTLRVAENSHCPAYYRYDEGYDARCLKDKLGIFADIDEEGNQKGNSDNGGHCLFVSIVDKHRSQRPNHSHDKRYNGNHLSHFFNSSPIFKG